jgi:protein TonB
MPRKAIEDGSEGVVKAQALVKDGVVKEVTILSGPRVFHAAVKAAMMQYKCAADSAEILATQEFVFKIESSGVNPLTKALAERLMKIFK